MAVLFIKLVFQPKVPILNRITHKNIINKTTRRKEEEPRREQFTVTRGDPPTKNLTHFENELDVKDFFLNNFYFLNLKRD